MRARFVERLFLTVTTTVVSVYTNQLLDFLTLFLLSGIRFFNAPTLST